MTESKKIAAPAALAVLTLASAAYFAVFAVAIPSEARSSTRRRLAESFPGGCDFASADLIGGGKVRVRGLRAFSGGSPFPWFEADTIDFETAPDGGLLSVVIGKASLYLSQGLVPEGAFQTGGTEGRFPAARALSLDVFSGTGLGGLQTPALRGLSFVYAPEAGGGAIEGAFQCLFGGFSLRGKHVRGGPTGLRAVLANRESAASAGETRMGPLVLESPSAGAFTLVFGRGGEIALSGGVSARTARIECLDSGFSGVKVELKGRLEKNFAVTVKIEAESGRAGPFPVEKAEITAGGPGFMLLAGKVGILGGKLVFTGSAVSGLSIDARLSSADLAKIPPGLLGAATPSSGSLEGRFSLADGALSGSFKARDAALWNVPVISLAGNAAARLGAPGSDSFSLVEGDFSARGGEVVLRRLDFEGGRIGLELSAPGRISADRKIFLDFAVHLEGGTRDRGDLPPFEELFRALDKAITAPFRKALSFRMKIRGTLDKPEHAISAPPLFRRD